MCACVGSQRREEKKSRTNNNCLWRIFLFAVFDVHIIESTMAGERWTAVITMISFISLWLLSHVVLNICVPRAKAQRRRRCLPNDNEWCQANIGISLISTDGKRQIDCSAYIFVVVVVVFCPIIKLVGQIWLWAVGADERERSSPVFYCSSIDKVKYLNNFSHELARSAKRNERIVSWNTKCAPNYHHHTQTPTHTQNLFAFEAQIHSS